MAQTALCPEIASARKYRRYHSEVKLAEKLGILPQRLRLIIPRSTRSHWRNEDDQMLKRVNFIRRNLVRQVRNPKKLLAPKKTHIVRIIRRFSPLCGRKMILRAFGISARQFHYWARNIHKCASTFAGLCRIKHPFQLTLSEIKKFKEYLKDVRFACWSRVSIYYQMLRDGVLSCCRSTFYVYR